MKTLKLLIKTEKCCFCPSNVQCLSEQCRVKLTTGRVKSHGGVVGIEDVITSRRDRRYLFVVTYSRSNSM